jgi:hypothetical protein
MANTEYSGTVRESPRACKNFGVWFGNSLSRVSPGGAWHSKVEENTAFTVLVIASMGVMEVPEKEKRKIKCAAWAWGADRSVQSSGISGMLSPQCGET